METQTETPKKEEAQGHGYYEYGNIIPWILSIIMIIGMIYFFWPHNYHAEINGINVKFDTYPSHKDSAYINICSNIIKDVAGADCKVKKIIYERGSYYVDPDVTIILSKDGHPQKVKYQVMEWLNQASFERAYEDFSAPRYIENRIKAYPEFKIKKTDYGFTTYESWLYYRESIDWKSKGKIYYFDKNGNRIESPVPEWSKAS